MSSQYVKDSDDEFTKMFLSDKISIIINIVSYFLLILTTAVIGWGYLGKAGLSKQKIEILKNVSVGILVSIWAFFLISNIIKVIRF